MRRQSVTRLVVFGGLENRIVLLVDFALVPTDFRIRYRLLSNLLLLRLDLLLRNRKLLQSEAFVLFRLAYMFFYVACMHNCIEQAKFLKTFSSKLQECSMIDVSKTFQNAFSTEYLPNIQESDLYSIKYCAFTSK